MSSNNYPIPGRVYRHYKGGTVKVVFQSAPGPRARGNTRHPDRGGSREQMDELTAAIAEARRLGRMS